MTLFFFHIRLVESLTIVWFVIVRLCLFTNWGCMSTERLSWDLEMWGAGEREYHNRDGCVMFRTESQTRASQTSNPTTWLPAPDTTSPKSKTFLVPPHSNSDNPRANLHIRVRRAAQAGSRSGGLLISFAYNPGITSVPGKALPALSQ